MSNAFSDLTINASGQITIPTDTFVARVGGDELSWLEHDSTHRSAITRNFNLIPNTGNVDSLTEILGGQEGIHICLRPKIDDYDITIVDSATLRLSTGTARLTESWHCILFVRLPSGIYAKATM